MGKDDKNQVVYTGPVTGSGTLVNPGTTPVVYTDDGKLLGAGERVRVPSLDATGQTAVRRGQLKWKPDPTGSNSSATDDEPGTAAESEPITASPKARPPR